MYKDMLLIVMLTRINPITYEAKILLKNRAQSDSAEKTSEFGPDAMEGGLGGMQLKIEMNPNTEKCLDRNSFCSIHS